MDTATKIKSTKALEIKQRFSRRALLAMTGRGAVALALLSISRPELIPSANGEALLEAGLVKRVFTESDRKTLKAVQEHPLPSEAGSPGANEIRATAYLEVALSSDSVDPGDYSEIISGIKRLNEISKERFAREFMSCTQDQKEKILRVVEDDESGEEWLTLLMGYTIEAYVGDPVHGGNPDGIVWRWLGHTPGSPRPSGPLSKGSA